MCLIFAGIVIILYTTMGGMIADQISDLVAAGVDGIHLYTMNNPAVARQISDSVSAIRRV